MHAQGKAAGRRGAGPQAISQPTPREQRTPPQAHLAQVIAQEAEAQDQGTSQIHPA